MSMTQTVTGTDSVLTDEDLEALDDVVLDVSIKRLTPNLSDLPFDPTFRYHPAFVRHLPIQGRADTTLSKLVAAAEAILAHPRLGLNAVTTARICRVAGTSIGTFYRYFEDEIAILDYVFPERLVYLTQGS
jgi:hypothetical protein